MTKVKFTREMYARIDELQSLYTVRIPEPERKKLADELKVNIKDLGYRIHLVKERKNILTWRIDEFRVLREAKSFDDFIVGFRKIYGDPFDRNIALNHWQNRHTYLAAYGKEVRKVHNVQPPKTKTEPATPPEDVPIKDEKDRLREITDMMKEIMLIMKDLLLVQKNTYALFEAIDKRGREKKA